MDVRHTEHGTDTARICNAEAESVAVTLQNSAVKERHEQTLDLQFKSDTAILLIPLLHRILCTLCFTCYE